MRVAVVFFAEQQKSKMQTLTDGLVKGIESQGHQVDLINGEKDVNSKLTIYSYIVVGAVAASPFGGKINEKIGKYIGESGMVAGKRCFAFTPKYGIRTGKTLSRLMSVMEKEGMFLKFSSVINNKEEAEAIGKKLRIQ